MTVSRHRRFRTVFVVLALAAGLSSASAANRDFRGGNYQGLIDAGNELNPVRVQFEPVDGGWRAQVRVGDMRAPLPATVTIDGQRLGLHMAGPNGPLDCVGIIGDASVLSDPTSGGCRLELAATNGGALARTLGGAWRDQAGHVYAIARTGDSPEPMWLDYGTGAWRELLERDGALRAGPSGHAPLPETIRLVPHGDALRLHQPGAPRRGLRLTRIALPELPVQWTAGDAVLKGTLILPEGKGPFPAIVLTQMSSPSDREAYRQFAYFFAAHGVASLIYDRRGLGQSGGDEASAGMHRLADDAVAAAEMLAAMPQIDAKRIGTWGHSQGGWIAPIAAARSDRIAFVIAQSASAVAPAAQEIFRIEHNARDAGLDETEVAAAVDYERKLMEWVRSGRGREEVHALAKANKDARWARFVELREDLPEKPSARSQSFWWFDPAPDLARVRVPALFIHGDRDGFVPVEASLPILHAALAHSDARFVLLPRTAHGLWTGEADSARYVMRSPGFHPDYWPTMLGWLRQQGIAITP